MCRHNQHYDGPGGCLFHLLGLTALVLAFLLSAVIISIPIGFAHKVIEVESKKAEVRQAAHIKAEQERQQKEMNELYRARPEWGFKPNTPHQP